MSTTIVLLYKYNSKHTMHRWLKSSGVSLSSEKKQRKVANEQVGDNLKAETAPFSFNLTSGGEELRAAAHVFIPNLVQKVVQLLEQNERFFKITHTMCTCDTKNSQGGPTHLA